MLCISYPNSLYQANQAGAILTLNTARLIHSLQSHPAMWATSTVWVQKVPEIFCVLKTCQILHWKLDDGSPHLEERSVEDVTCSTYRGWGEGAQVFWASDFQWCFFRSPPFLDSNGGTSHQGFPSHCSSLVNHWESESRYWNLSLFHTLLRGLIPPHAHLQRNIKLQSVAAFSCGKAHPCMSTPGVCRSASLCSLSSTIPAYLLAHSAPMKAFLHSTRWMNHARALRGAYTLLNFGFWIMAPSHYLCVNTAMWDTTSLQTVPTLPQEEKLC